MLLGATLAAASLLAGCNDKGAPAPTATTTAAPLTTPCGTEVTPAPTAPASVTPGPTSGGDAKTFACGAKGQEYCPMQKWMKSVMASASSSNEGEKLAKALGYVAGHAPPGYDEWANIAKAGVAKAKADDIDGAKMSCKQCHDLYKDRYKATMRDRPF
jgi:hypothetical protein